MAFYELRDIFYSKKKFSIKFCTSFPLCIESQGPGNILLYNICSWKTEEKNNVIFCPQAAEKLTPPLPLYKEQTVTNTRIPIAGGPNMCQHQPKKTKLSSLTPASPPR